MTSETSAHRHDFPVHWPVQTRWTDNDMFGHLNNAVYYALFDTAINAWLGAATGHRPADGPVRWASSLRIRAAATSPSSSSPTALVVGLAVTRLGTSSVTYRTRRCSPRPKPPMTWHHLPPSGTWVHVYVDRATRQARPDPRRASAPSWPGNGARSPA